MNEIVINPFDIASIQDALKQLEEYDIAKKGDELARRMAEVCAETARSHYRPGDGNEDVTVSVSKVENGYEVSAVGDDVYFMEFGAGVSAGAGYDTSVITPPVDISPGSWSSTRGTGEYARYKSWHHKKRKYTGLVPQKGMYYGTKEATERMEEIANEVFRND